MLDPVVLGNHVEAHWPGTGRVPIAGLISELNAIIGRDRVDATGQDAQKVLKEFPSHLPVGLVGELGDGELAGAVNGNEQVKLSLRRLQGHGAPGCEARYGVVLLQGRACLAGTICSGSGRGLARD